MHRDRNAARGVQWGWRTVGAIVVLAAAVSPLRGQDVEEAMNAAGEAARTRVAEDAAQRGAAQWVPAEGQRVRRRAALNTGAPVYRLGVAYFDEWTIRAGALKLLLPAYEGWAAARPASEFYETQAVAGDPGEHLAQALINDDFVRATRSKYVNNYGLVWVPQDYAFSSMTDGSFAEVKERLRDFVLEQRQHSLGREDFDAFEDFVAFKAGQDESLGELQDGYWVLAVDEPGMITYFATSEFVYRTAREEQRQPMIMTMTYALVRGKVLRFDFKRISLSDEDPVQLITFTQRFVSDMRQVNGLGDRKIR